MNEQIQKLERELSDAKIEIERLRRSAEFFQRMSDTWECNSKSWELLYEVSKLTTK